MLSIWNGKEHAQRRQGPEVSLAVESNMNQQQHEPPSFWRSPSSIAMLVATAVGGFYLYTEHRAHLFGFLPYLFLLACPAMHFFMHRGHGHGGHSHGQPRSTDDERRDL